MHKVVMTFGQDWIYLYSLARGIVVAHLISIKFGADYVHLRISMHECFHDNKYDIFIRSKVEHKLDSQKNASFWVCYITSWNHTNDASIYKLKSTGDNL